MPSQEFLEQHHYHKVELDQFMYDVPVSDIDELLAEIATLEAERDELKAKLEAMEEIRDAAQEMLDTGGDDLRLSLALQAAQQEGK